MEILITGGNGFLGRNLVLALQERGDNVRVLALPKEDTTWLEERDVAVFRGDILNPDALITPMLGVEGVFHLAAMIGAWRAMQDYYAVNVTGTEHVCQAALEAGVRRLVHISSAMVYNMAMGRAVTEDDPLEPLDEPYSLTKAQGDMLPSESPHSAITGFRPSSRGMVSSSTVQTISSLSIRRAVSWAMRQRYR